MMILFFNDFKICVAIQKFSQKTKIENIENKLW